MKMRGSGILLHITSLPSRYGIGDLGPSAYDFANFLDEARQSFWQILPLNPTDPAYDSSPYHSTSAFGGNTLLISPELLVRDGLLEEKDIEGSPAFPGDRVDYDAVRDYKVSLFDVAFERFKKTGNHDGYETFCSENSPWLDDYALFTSLKDHFRAESWSQWPREIRDRQPRALQSLKRELRDKMGLEKFLQFVFNRQWLSLKRYCNTRGVQIIGDLPIYVCYDSVDLWTLPEIFKLNDRKEPYAVAGVPPDYFSETGQLWGNPVYRWDVLKEKGYDWWMRRMEYNLRLFDVIRVDHFRGLVAYWEIDANEKTAVNGKWVAVPAKDFFQTMIKRFSSLSIIAEDLGIITPDVREVMKSFQIPGMKVLLFAFGDKNPMHPYLPHAYEKRYVVYTGTHDTNTVKGWFEKEAKPEERERCFRYLGREVQIQDIHWEFIRLAMMSVANVAVFPVQDALGLGEEARINRPGTQTGNWRWRLQAGQLTPSVRERLREMTEIYGRAKRSAP